MGASPTDPDLVLSGVACSGMRKLHEQVTVQAEARPPLRGRTIPIAVQGLMRAMPRLGPYVVLATVLPGGLLVAPLLYLYRRRASAELPSTQRRTISDRALQTLHSLAGR